MMSHPTFTLLAAVLISISMAMVEHRSTRERLYVAARVFFCCALTTLCGGWFMSLIHG
jgi:MFS superfamily sulfate permease-like transporter